MIADRQGDITTNGLRLHYYRSGSGARPLVLAHGLTDHGLCWAPIAAQLAADYDIVMYDARGHGRSDQPATGYTYDQLAADLAGLIQALELEQPVVIGHSMGAATAALAAARYPGLMRAVVLEDPPMREEATDAELAQLVAEWRRDTLARKQLGAAELIAQERAMSPKWSDAELGPWAEAKQLVSPHTLEIVRTPGTQWYTLVDQIACPILLITADPAQGAIVTPAGAAMLAGRWRDGRVANIADAGHCIRRDQPAPFMRVLGEFLGTLHQHA